MTTQQHRKEFKDILEKTFLPEWITDKERNERLLPLSRWLLAHQPASVFRYRECTEMNIEALNEDKIYAVTADKFNDPYDCLFRYDKEGLRNSMMNGMSKDVIYALRKHFRNGGTFPEQLNGLFENAILENVKQSIENASDDDVEQYGKNTAGIMDLFNELIDKQTDAAVQTVKQLAFIACFSETINSVTMWSHYANSHTGFALEYDTKSFLLKCQSCDKQKQCDNAIACNLYPIIYQNQRYDATDFLGWYIGRSAGMPIKNLDTFATSKAFLYKSSQWGYEKEWRLVVSKMNDFQDKSPVCIYHINPTAIYYGSKISPINQKILHLIAQEKGIKEYQMEIDNKSFKYTIKAKKNGIDCLRIK